jgi:hypothetical protein
LADLDRQRLGVRWQRARKGAKATNLVDDAMRGEVGQLAFAESIDLAGDRWLAARLYVEPDPPGRDVFVAYSAATGRLIQVVYQAAERDRVLRESIVPTLADRGEVMGKSGGARVWRVFWLTVVLPRPLKLLTQRLNVGDLALSFETPEGDLIVRQVAAARVATARRPLEKWLGTLAEPKRYRAVGQPEAATMAGMTGLMQHHVRRRRLWWVRWLPRQYVACCLHDVAADRLVIVRAPSQRWAVDTLAGAAGQGGEGA